MPEQPPLRTPTRTPIVPSVLRSISLRSCAAAAAVTVRTGGFSRRWRTVVVVSFTSRAPVCSEAISHEAQLEPGRLGHPIRRPRRIPYQLDRDVADTFDIADLGL